MNIVASTPLHPLFVHIPVVLVPLLALAAVALAVRRSWFERFGIVTAGLAVVAAFATLITSQTGEDLQEKVQRSAKVHQHVELGDQAKVVIAGFLLVLFLWIALDWFLQRRASRPAQAGIVLKVMMAGSLVLGVLATVWVVRAGHSGAAATWDGKTTQTSGGGDDDGG